MSDETRYIVLFKMKTDMADWTVEGRLFKAEHAAGAHAAFLIRTGRYAATDVRPVSVPK